MVLFSPRSITLVEANPETIVGYIVTVRRASDNELLHTGEEVASDPSGTTIIAIGSTGDLIGLTDEVVQLYVQEVAAPGHGNNPDPQQASGGPFTVVQLADGSENITVTV